MTDNIAIKVENVSKAFKLPHEKTNSVKSAVVNFYRSERTFEKQQVLNNVSFEIKKGEFFGIVGRNGSGKSTLLKLIAGIYSPDQGAIVINGRLTPFIELGVGFNPELTGRDNVFLNGALLGFNRKEMTLMYDDIVEFAELGRFMDQKLKNYSSGMQVRLAFSIAIRANTEILILDEVLAVGDERFQNKCIGVFEDLKKAGKTIVLVTHDMNSVKRFCDSAIVIHDSRLVFEGTASKVASEYTRLNFPEAMSSGGTYPGANDVRVKAYGGTKEKTLFTTGEHAIFDVTWTENSKAKNVGLALFTRSGEYVYGTNTIIDNISIAENKVRYELELNLGAGDYYLQVGVFGKNDSDLIYFSERAKVIKIINDDQWQGLTKLKHEWRKI